MLNKPKIHVNNCYQQKFSCITFLFFYSNKASNSNLYNRSNVHQQDDTLAFKHFLFRHIEEALTNTWSNDGIFGGGRNELTSFDLCTYSTWIHLFNVIRELFETTPPINKIMRQAFGTLRANIDPDGKLNETRCKKYLPIAIKYYEDGLPSRYTRHYHEQRVCIEKNSIDKKKTKILFEFFFFRIFKLEATKGFFATYARGSSYKRYVQQLIEQCTYLWQDGRQLCEAISLTGNSCKNEV